MEPLKSTPEDLLVAVDFSRCSLRALDRALAWRSPTAELTVLHVLDSEFVERAGAYGLGDTDQILVRLRERAEEEIGRLIAERQAERVETMIVVGTPFVEIVKLANDLECDLIVIGIHGHDSGLKQILFGGTAEKVLRGASRPVLCVP